MDNPLPIRLRGLGEHGNCSPIGVRKRVLVNFELEKKNDSGDDEFDIFIICLRRLGPQPHPGCAPSV